MNANIRYVLYDAQKYSYRLLYSRRKYYCYHQIFVALIALPTLRQQKLSLLISLLFCRLGYGFFSVLLPIQLSLFQLLRQQYLSRAISLERKQSKKKHRTDTKKDSKRIKSDNYARSDREKSNIAIAILTKLRIGWQHNYFVFWWQQ